MLSFINLLLGLLLLSPLTHGQTFEETLEKQFKVSTQNLLKNINSPGAVPGTVVASPSTANPDYYYHWVRDASLVMSTIARLHRLEKITTQERQQYLKLLEDYRNLTDRQQTQRTFGGLGEVKFYVDGNAFLGPWGRPQNDGPALRALALMALANIKLENGDEAFVKNHLYQGNLPAQSVIKRDLEYVSHHWRDYDHDLWEEVSGRHFFTRLVQRRALLEGAQLARRLGDGGAAKWYELQAEEIAMHLGYHWSPQAGYFLSTLEQKSGVWKSGLDSSVILAAIERDEFEDPLFAVSDERFLATAHKLNESFSEIYGVNSLLVQNGMELGTAIGRYPEDQYDGYSTGRIGNPWFLTTAGVANFYYSLAKKFKAKEVINITPINQAFFRALPAMQQNPGQSMLTVQDPAFHGIIRDLIAEGDKYMKRIHFHMGRDGSMSEQFNRGHGFMQGAVHLTWSYSSYINAYLSRKSALE